MTMTAEKETVTGVDVKPTDLVRVLDNVSLFLSPVKEARPAIQQTEITFSSEGLTFVATDSFALIRETLPVDVPESLRGRVCLLNLHDFRPVLKVIKSAGLPVSIIPLEDGKVTLESAGMTFTSAYLGSFPAWQNIMPKDLDGIQKSAPVGIGVWQLARLGKIKRDNDQKPVDLRVAARMQLTDPLKPLEFTIGSDIQVIVMPVRMP
jgi:hypothetical protein